MKNNFNEELSAIREKAFNYIKHILNKRGTDYQLIDPDIIDERDPEFYDLPRAIKYYEKYGTTQFDEFCIVDIKIEGDTILFSGVSVDDSAEDYSFSDQDISIDTVCGIADLVYNLEN